MSSKISSAFRDLVARARTEPVLSIMIFHRVLERPDPFHADEPDSAGFAKIARLARKHFHCISLSQAMNRLDSNVPGHMLAITFDDGYADNFEIALPVLRRFELPATIFIASGYLDGGIMWNDRVGESIKLTRAEVVDLECIGEEKLQLNDMEQRQKARRKVVAALKYRPQKEREELAKEISAQLGVAPRSDLMLSSDQLVQLGKEELIEVGGHTHSHPILANTDSANVALEMARGKSRLESIIDQPVRGFAYPNGQPGRDYLPEHVQLAREAGFSYAVSTQWGAAGAGADRYQLPRFTPWRRDMLGFAVSLLRVARNRELSC